MIEGVHHVALAVSDIPSAVSFYEEVLEFDPIGPDSPEATIGTAECFWMDIGGGEWISFADRPDATPDYPGENDDPRLAFRATEDEISTITQRLAERNVTVRDTRTSIYFHDPDGNFLELTHWDGPDR